MKVINYRSNTGFSLLEILVAFSIMAMAMGILLRIFSGGVNTAILVSDYTQAIQIAESQLAVVGIEDELEEGENSGTFADKFRWNTVITAFDPGMDDFTVEQLPVEPFQVQVTVEWGEGKGVRSFSLDTLRLKPHS